MANKKVDISQRLGNRPTTSGSGLILTSIIDENVEEINIENEALENEQKIEENLDDNSEKDISFQSRVRKLRYMLENEDDIKRLSYDIDVILHKVVNSIQIEYIKKNEKMTEKYYIDKEINFKLLRQAFDEVRSLILKTNLEKYEMDDYFTRIIDECIHERFNVISRVGIEGMQSPAEIETLLRGFVSIDELDEEIVEDYIKEQMNLVYDIIYNRVERSTFFVTELVSEALKLYDEDNRKGISVNLNELLLKSIDEKYLKLAKININNRKPKYDKMMKNTKRKAKMHQ